MNRAYRLVWSRANNAWVVASEKTKGRGKSSGKRLSAIALSLFPLLGQASPIGGQVVSGIGTINQSGSLTTINQSSQNLVVNWKSFNVGSNEAVNFLQPSASSIAVNRIYDTNGTQIMGQLNANGQVWLLNPNGILFGKGAQVNVGGLVASTLDSVNQNGSAFSFSGNGPGKIINQGTINGHYVALIGNTVSNTGTIAANLGTVALGAGSAVTLTFSGNDLVHMQVDRGILNALVSNGGVIEADGGYVMMTAGAKDELLASVVNNTGIVRAETVEDRNGTITLLGGMKSGTVNVSGTLDASAPNGGNGGKIMVSANAVNVNSGATLDATGPSGGTIEVGGGVHGSDASLPNATTVNVATGAVLDASATGNGNGGTIAVWSNVSDTNSTTRAYGTLLATGGASGGAGGIIETSGHWLDVAGIHVNASSYRGNAGQWLLDPYSVTISSSSAVNSSGWAPTGTGSNIWITDLLNALQGGTSITATTGTSGSEIGDITVNAPIAMTSGTANVTLTLQAADSIIVNQAISNTSAYKLNVKLLADNDNGTHNGVGVVMLNNSISTNGGYIQFGDGSTLSINGVNTMVGGDVYVGGSSAINLTTNGGAVTVNGQMLIANTSGLSISTSNGNVSFGGMLDSGNTYSYVSSSGISWTSALSGAASGTQGAVGSTYLATPSTRLDNAVASSTAGYQNAWLGGERALSGCSGGLCNTWYWAAGPLGLANSGTGTAFFTQNGSATSNGSGGTAINGAYTNWNSGEPNNSGGANLTSSGASEYVMQFTGSSGNWNDLNPTNSSVAGYVKETNLATSPLTVNAGTGTVTFSGAVGSNKALASLNLTAATVAVNGGSVTTQGIQTYNGNMTLGSSSTTLSQTNANTDFTLQAGKSITNATGADASLTIKTTQNILLYDSSSISSSTGKLNVTLNSDSDTNQSGAIVIGNATLVNSNGGNIVLGGGSDPSTTPAYGNSTTYTESSHTGTCIDGITLFNNSNPWNGLAAAHLYANGGNIILNGYASGASNSSGVDMNVSSQVTTTGNGSITIVGNGGTSGIGVGLDRSLVEVQNGSISITGTAASSSQYAVVQRVGVGTESTGTGSITVKGIVGSLYFGLSPAPILGGTSDTGNITLIADSIALNSSTVQSTGALTIEPYTTGTSIGIGGSGTLSLPASYFSTNFVNGFSSITVGNANAGAITLGSALSLNANTVFISGSDINIAGTITDTGNTLTLNAQSNININSTINGSGTAGLVLEYGQGAVAAGNASTYTVTAPVNLASTGSFSTKLGSDGAVVNYTIIDSLGAAGSTTSTDLQGMNGNLAGKYALGSNIDATATSTWNSGAGFTPIGNSTTNFTGSFDGLGHTISNLTINLPSTSYVGLFGQTGSSSDIRNVGLAGSGNITGLNMFGGIAGENYGSIVNSYVTSTNTFTGYNYGGGLVGRNNGAGKISSSYATVAVSGHSFIGGLVGGNWNSSATISNSYATGNVSMTRYSVGGLVGENHGTISNSYATGTVSGGNAGNGGLTGMNYGTISNSYATGAVSGSSYVGGLTGKNTSTGSVNTSYAAGAVSGSSNVGGLLGKNSGSVTSSYWNTTVNTSVAGIGTGNASTAVTGLSTTQMQQLASFTPSGTGTGKWDFATAVWGFSPSGANNGYPILCALSSCATVAFVEPTSGSSIYGSAPVLSFSIVDSGGATLALTNASVSGTASYSGVPTSSSSVGTYGVSYSSGLSLSGSGASNYLLETWATPVTWTVIPKALTVTGETAATKVYDGTTAAALSGGSLVGVISGDTVNLTQAGSFVDKNVGNAISVTASDSISGSSAANYALTQPTGLSANITPANLTLSGSKVYDGTTTLAGSNLTATGVNGETFTVTGNGDTTNLSSKNVQSNSTLASVTGLSLGLSSNGGNSSNYNALSTTGSSINVTARPVTLTGTETYNGSTSVSGSILSASNLASGDSLTISGSATLASKNAGSESISSFGTLALSNSNYTLAGGRGSVTVNKLALTGASIAAVNTTYGTAANSGAVSFGNVVSGDVVTDTASIDSPAYSTSGNLKAGSYTQSASTTLGGADSGNYSFSGFTTPTANYVVSKLALTGSISAGSSTYGSSLNPGTASFTNAIANDVLGTATVSVASVGNLSSSGNLKAGSYTGIESITGLSGSDAGNYTYSGITGDYVVGKLALTGASISAVNTTYGTAANSGAVSFGNVVSGDVVTDTASIDSPVTSTSGNLKAGSYTQSASTTLSGTDAGNYTFSGFTSAANYVVNKLALTGASIAAVNTTYGTAANSGAVSFGNVVSGDVVTDTASIDSPVTSTSGNLKAGSYTQSASSTLGGADSGNYTFAGFTSTANYVVSPLALSITGETASSKVYDGTTAAALSGGSLSGVISGDMVNPNQAGIFASKNVGNAIAVTVSDSLSGSAAGNYTLTQPTGLVANITPATLTYVATPLNAMVGEPITGLSGTVTGLVGGDSLAGSTTGNLAWSTTATSSSQPGQYDIDGSGLSAANYVFVQASGNKTALTMQAGTPPQDVQSVSTQVVSVTNPASSQPLDMTPSTTITPTNSQSTSGSGSGQGTVVNTNMSIGESGSLHILNGGTRLPDNVVGQNAGSTTEINLNQGLGNQ